MGSSTASLGQYKDKNRKLLSDLPPIQRLIIEALITPRELPYKTILEQASQSDSTINTAQFDNALFELVQQGFLVSYVEAGEVCYFLQYDLTLRPEKRDEVSRRSSQLDILDE